MARIKGQANYASNFEVLKQAPLDSRTVVSDSGDLIKIATWQDADGNVWLYDGLIVTVPNTNNPSAPEAYILKDKDNYGRPDAWLKLGADNASEVAAIQEALKKKANLTNGKVPANELPIATSLGNPNNGTIPSTFAVNEAINNKIVGLLNWQGVKDTTSEIKAITSAKKGDVWHSNGDGSEWVCTQDITTANADAWTELGTPIDLSGYYTKNDVDYFFYKRSDAEALESKVEKIRSFTPITSAVADYYSHDMIGISTKRINFAINNGIEEDGTGISIKSAAYDLSTKQYLAGVMSGPDKEKLDGIAKGANNYTHPTHTAYASGFYKITVDNLGHVSATTPVIAKDLTDLGVATATSVSDLEMSFANKISGIDTKIGTINTTIGNVNDSTGNSLYAKINANTTSISTKASNSDLAALQSKVELKANQSDIPTAVQLVVKTI